MENRRYSTRREAVPFPIPEELKSVLLGYPLETGAGGGVGDVLPATAVWTILNDTGDAVGQVWLNEQSQPGAEVRRFINVCVYDTQRSKGAASAALPMVEEQLHKDGVKVLYAQVNSNRADTGLRVRRWIISHGYTLLREGIASRRAHLSDDEVIATDPCTLMFEKRLQP